MTASAATHAVVPEPLVGATEERFDDESFELPYWSRTLAGWRERFVLPFRFELASGGPVLEIQQSHTASAEHAKEAKASVDGLATGSTVWDAGVVCAAHVYASHRGQAARAGVERRCLDLGSGTGVVGLAAAASGAFSHVMLTDLPSVVSFMQRNISANRSVTGTTEVLAAALRWEESADLRAVAAAHGPFDLIVGGDLLYRPPVVEPLLHALRALVAPSTTVLLAASIQHSPETLRAFVAAAAAAFHVVLLPFDEQPSEYASEEVRLLRLTRR